MITRDGKQVSLWQDTIAPYMTQSNPAPDTAFDVVIVGGGITGITTALLLQEAGRRCLVIEAETLCFGTTGGTTAHLNTLLDTPYSQVEKNFSKEAARQVATATSDAIDLVRRNVERFGIGCGFEMADAYLYSQNEEQSKELTGIRAGTEQAGLTVYSAGTIPVPFAFEQAIRVPGQAKFSPVQYVYGLARAFENAGGVILQHCRLLDLEENDRATVLTTKGNFYADRVVYATHIPPGINLLHLRCAPYRSYAIAVELQNGNYPEGLSYDMYDPYHYYRSQQINGSTYLIAGGYDHKTGHETNTGRCFLELEAHVREHFDVKQVAYQWSSQYFEPSDGLPYIGRLPGHSDLVYTATGFGGNGMTYSHVAARVLKEILLNEEGPYTTLFDPNRLKPVAGFKNFIAHNADVVKQFVGKFFERDKLEELADLAPGEGRVVTYEGEKIAIHKDESGRLQVINPACTHMKCNVAWNNAEGSWDCPCHGARYAANGQVLTGPATIALEEISLAELAKKES